MSTELPSLDLPPLGSGIDVGVASREQHLRLMHAQRPCTFLGSCSATCGHQRKRPLDRRLVASQNPCPSYTNTLIDVARRLRNTNRQPENGSAFSLARHNSASESMPLRKSTASTATRIRICGVSCSMAYWSAKL